MGAIHVHEFMSLDGVIDAPTWTFEYGFHPRMGEAIGGVTERRRGILLGRTTYEMFEPAWSTRTVEDDPGAPFFNETTKYVVSGTLTNATWRNSKVVGPYDPAAIRGLKNEVDGDLYVSGSVTLVRAMLADGLVDDSISSSTRSRAGPVRGSSPKEPRLAACRCDLRVVRERSGIPGLPTGGVKPHRGPGAGRRRTMRFATTEERDTTMQYGVEEGTKGGYARVDELLQRLPFDA